MSQDKCIDDAAYVDAAQKQGQFEVQQAITREIIAGGVLAAQILVRNSISDKEDEIGQRQIAVAERFRSQLRKFWDVDKALISEACAAPKPSAEYSTAHTFVNLIGEPNCDDNLPYCVKNDPCSSTQTALSMMIHKVDSANFGLRFAENRQIAKEDLRWARRYKALASARGISSGAARLADYTGTIGRGAALGAIVSGALATAGFLSMAKPMAPTYQGRREYSWGGQEPVEASKGPFIVSSTSPVRMPQIEGTPLEPVKESSYTSKNNTFEDYARANGEGSTAEIKGVFGGNK